MLSSSISYWDWLKCLYFADTTERGDRGWKKGGPKTGWREGYFTDNSTGPLLCRISHYSAGCNHPFPPRSGGTHYRPTNVSHLNLKTGCTRARLFDLLQVALTLYTCNCQVWVLSKCVEKKLQGEHEKKTLVP
jgi:hypothetical protein